MMCKHMRAAVHPKKGTSSTKRFAVQPQAKAGHGKAGKAVTWIDTSKLTMSTKPSTAEVPMARRMAYGAELAAPSVSAGHQKEAKSAGGLTSNICAANCRVNVARWALHVQTGTGELAQEMAYAALCLQLARRRQDKAASSSSRGPAEGGCLYLHSCVRKSRNLQGRQPLHLSTMS